MHVMIDLETLGNGANAPILSIGAVVFDRERLGEQFYTRIDLSSSLQGGASPDAATIEWWMGQGDTARKDAFLSGDGCDEREALLNFSSFCNGIHVEGMWGNGPSFDNAILGTAYRRNGMTQPWDFWLDRDLRTAKAMFPEVNLPHRVGTHHNALDDAIYQAQCLMEIGHF